MAKPPAAVKRPAKARVRGLGLGRLLTAEWWPLEVAIVWIATGDVKLCEAAFRLVSERRASPADRSPSLGSWLRTYESYSTLKEDTPGAIYRERIRDDWKPGDRHGLHPLEKAMDEAAGILRSHIRSKRGRTRDTRRLSRGKQNSDEATWIPTRAWLGVKLVDHRKWGVVILGPDGKKTGHWHDIEVLAEPFKVLGADRGRRTIAQSTQPSGHEGNNERIQRKLAKHDAMMGRAPKKRRGRPKGSTNVPH